MNTPKRIRYKGQIYEAVNEGKHGQVQEELDKDSKSKLEFALLTAISDVASKFLPLDYKTFNECLLKARGRLYASEILSDDGYLKK